MRENIPVLPSTELEIQDLSFRVFSVFVIPFSRLSKQTCESKKLKIIGKENGSHFFFSFSSFLLLLFFLFLLPLFFSFSRSCVETHWISSVCFDLLYWTGFEAGVGSVRSYFTSKFLLSTLSLFFGKPMDQFNNSFYYKKLQESHQINDAS